MLYGHPRITEAALVAIPDDEVTNRLKAFIVTDEPNSLAARQVRDYCRERLPKYMVPEFVEFRAALPRTSTGKVDRNVLLRQERERENPE